MYIRPIEPLKQRTVVVVYCWFDVNNSLPTIINASNGYPLPGICPWRYLTMTLACVASINAVIIN